MKSLKYNSGAIVIFGGIAVLYWIASKSPSSATEIYKKSIVAGVRG